MAGIRPGLCYTTRKEKWQRYRQLRQRFFATSRRTHSTAAAAGGILGILGYLSTVVSGIGFGWMAQTWGWNAAYATILVCAVLGGLTVLMMWKAPAEQGA